MYLIYYTKSTLITFVNLKLLKLRNNANKDVTFKNSSSIARKITEK